MLIVTRHAALADYAIDAGIAPAGTRWLPNATADDIRGQDVIGPLPLYLAALARSITHIPLTGLTGPVEHGHELTLDEVRRLAGRPAKYVVRTVDAVAAETECGCGCGEVAPVRLASAECARKICW